MARAAVFQWRGFSGSSEEEPIVQIWSSSSQVLWISIIIIIGIVITGGICDRHMWTHLGGGVHVTARDFLFTRKWIEVVRADS